MADDLYLDEGTPSVLPEIGSLGASGDLTPLAHGMEPTPSRASRLKTGQLPEPADRVRDGACRDHACPAQWVSERRTNRLITRSLSEGRMIGWPPRCHQGQFLDAVAGREVVLR